MGRGRPTAFTPERVAKILKGLREGLTRRAAAGQGGITYETFNTWLKQDDKLIFLCQVEEAEQYAEAKFTASLKKAAWGQKVTVTKTTTKADGSQIVTKETRMEYDWRAAAEWLKRRRRDDWSEPLSVNPIAVPPKLGPNAQESLGEETKRKIREEVYGWFAPLPASTNGHAPVSDPSDPDLPQTDD